ncbi:MAG: type II toxin-antitoxin system RelE/ParE family toxin [Cyclobacteriaceae bacterium]|jgi:hypothetical protein
MSVEIIYTPDFERQFKRLTKKYTSLPSDLAKLASQLTAQPDLGTPLGSNLFKIRLKVTSKGKGKSGGARVITFLLRQDEELYLIAIYDKSEIDTLSKEQIRDVINRAGLF